MFANLHVAASQHAEVVPCPGSQSSPSSTIPFPHMLREMVCMPSLGAARHVVLTAFAEVESIREQMFPLLHGENVFCEDEVTGLMMYISSASQLLDESGQHTVLELQVPWQS